MKHGRSLAVGTALLAALVIAGAPLRGRDLSRALARDPAAAWAQAATHACWTIENRISARGYEHWEPLALANPPLALVALRRRELLELQEDALGQLRTPGLTSTSAAADAMERFERTLAATREVIRAAERGDATTYVEADLRMRRSILATRTAFERAGADHVCNFAI